MTNQIKTKQITYNYEQPQLASELITSASFGKY